MPVHLLRRTDTDTKKASGGMKLLRTLRFRAWRWGCIIWAVIRTPQVCMRAGRCALTRSLREDRCCGRGSRLLGDPGDHDAGAGGAGVVLIMLRGAGRRRALGLCLNRLRGTYRNSGGELEPFLLAWDWGWVWGAARPRWDRRGVFVAAELSGRVPELG